METSHLKETDNNNDNNVAVKQDPNAVYNHLTRPKSVGAKGDFGLFRSLEQDISQARPLVGTSTVCCQSCDTTCYQTRESFGPQNLSLFISKSSIAEQVKIEIRERIWEHINLGSPRKQPMIGQLDSFLINYSQNYLSENPNLIIFFEMLINYN